MFIGHYALGLAARKPAPGISLGTLFLASQFVDLLWPLFLLFGIEQVRIDPGNTAFTPLDFTHYPFTHSLLASVGWAVLFGLVYYALRRNGKGAVILGLLVLSHWVLDLIAHRPDLPLGFGDSVYFGFELWNSVAGTMIFETALFIGGILLFLKTSRAKDRIGKYGFWALIGILYIIYLANVFGPPPPDEGAIAVAGNALWLFVIWAYWVDRHRELKQPAGHGNL